METKVDEIIIMLVSNCFHDIYNFNSIHYVLQH